MKLLQVYSAKRHPSGNIDMEIRAEVDGEEMDVPFGYRPGDPHGLGPQLDAWWAENPKFPIAGTNPVSVSADQVKAEAARRIELIMKDYEQRNALALGQEMVLTYGPGVTTWPVDKQATLSAMLSKWASIKAIRAKSNDIEAASPIPADFGDDRYWS